MLLPWLLLFVVPLGIANILMPAVIFTTQKLSLLDHPDPSTRKEGSRNRKIHSIPTPRVGGIAIVLSFLSVLPFLEAPSSVLKIYIGSVCMFFLGLVDDLRPISARIKLIFQFIVAFATVYFSGLGISDVNIFSLSVPLGPVAGVSLSALIIVSVINSINMIDGMDGLAAGVSLIGILMMAYLHFYATKEFWLIRYFALIMTGSVLGFLQFNTYPAKIFMGDGGSHWLGFMSGVLLVMIFGNFVPSDRYFIAQSSEVSIPLLSVVMCLAVPVIDTITLIFYRIRHGNHPFSADNSHFHHSLQYIGLSQQQAVLLIYFVSFAFAAIGFSPLIYPDYNIEWLPISFFVSLVAGFYYSKEVENAAPFLARFLEYRNKKNARSPDSWVYRISRLWANLNRYIVYGILFVSSILANSVSENLSVINIGLALLISISGLFKVRKADFYFNTIIAISVCSILVSINQTNLQINILGDLYQFQNLYNVAFVFLLVSSFLYFFATLNRYRLTVTPTDFLFLAIPLLLILAPEPYNSRYYLSIISARTLVIFFVIRTFVVGYSSSMRKIRIVVLFSLLNLALSQ